mmetsp:Transcript_50236/g.119517  ORF Transcript_50236/g.119517 Transcript_50236/m.119517 type:complete len:100 (+) Transcript_50236:87-386(+)
MMQQPGVPPYGAPGYTTANAPTLQNLPTLPSMVPVAPGSGNLYNPYASGPYGAMPPPGPYAGVQPGQAPPTMPNQLGPPPQQPPPQARREKEEKLCGCL